MDNGLTSLLGLCRKAGKVEAGEDSAATAAKAHKARLLLLASDAGYRTQRHAEYLSETGNCPFLTISLTKEELGAALGRGSCVILALTDIGFASAVVKKLGNVNPEIQQRLEYKAEKTLRRRRETREREKEMQANRRKPWAAPPPGKKS